MCLLTRSPSLFYLLAHSRCRGCLFSLDHTQTHTTVCRTPLDEGSARRRDLYLTTHKMYKRQTSTPPMRFEPTIPASVRSQTYALDRAAAGIGVFKFFVPKTYMRVAPFVMATILFCPQFDNARWSMYVPKHVTCSCMCYLQVGCMCSSHL
jgi:hypothetical protein